MNRSLTTFLLVLLMSVVSVALQADDTVKTVDGFVPLFDGRTFDGWEGDTKNTWRIEEGAFVAGSLEVTVPRNEFLCTKREFENFELRIKYQLSGTEGFVNGGIQFRTKRIPDHHEVIGYQADLGKGYDGHLYDESRRRKMLVSPPKELVEKALKQGKDGWNEYVIRAEGSRIQMWLNGVQTVDFTEDDPKVDRKGVIAVQVHGGGKAIARYRDISIRELQAAVAR